jgi:lipoprotein-releasing system ATP-binding protein
MPSALNEETSPMSQALQESLPVPTRSAFMRASSLRKSYRMGDVQTEVLRGVALDIAAGEFIAIEGRSGSGKSTLLHLLGALDTPDSGSIEYQGQDLRSMNDIDRCRLRNREFGFVFQFYHLLPELNVLENVMLGAMVKYSWLQFRMQRKALRERGRAVLKDLGLDHRMRHRPGQLSGGERQRVAIGRALMNEPKIVFADEPTGNLDAETGRKIMDVLERLHREQGQTLVMVTHDRALAQQADRILVLRDGVMSPSDSVPLPPADRLKK